ncbi:hypothetical protein QYF36_009513 [Acer negundo]|nr:hypothetical protein QYF36_009513 [Acer negundo]
MATDFFIRFNDSMRVMVFRFNLVSPAPAPAPPAPAKETPVPAPAKVFCKVRITQHLGPLGPGFGVLQKAPPAPAPVPVSQPPPAPAPVPTKHKRRRRHKHPQSKAAIVDLQPPSSFSSHLAMCSSHLEIDVGLMFGDRTLEEKLFHGMQGCREVYAIM